MNTQMERPTLHGDHPVPVPHPGVGVQHSGEETEQHGEKKSVLKKVKAKAKKIKDSIKCHVGHSHDVEDEDEMVTDRDVHGVPVTHGVGSTTAKAETTGKHGSNIVEKTTVSGQVQNPGVNRAFNNTTTTAAHYVSGQDDETLESDHGPTHIDVIALGGAHRPKLGGIIHENEPHAPENVVERVNPASHRTNLVNPTTIGATHGTTAIAIREEMAQQQGTSICERTVIDSHVPVSSSQVFDTKTAHYVPGEEKTLSWSRTDKQTPTLLGSDNQAQGLRHKPVLTPHSGGNERCEIGGNHPALKSGEKAESHSPLSNKGAHRVFDTSTPHYVPGPEEKLAYGLGHKSVLGAQSGATDRPNIGDVFEKDHHAPKTLEEDIYPGIHRTDHTYPTSGSVQGISTNKADIARSHATNLGEKAAIGGDPQVFDTTTTHYASPKQEPEPLSWSRMEKQTHLGSYKEPGHHHSGGSYSTGDLGVGHKPKLGGFLERDPHASENSPKNVLPSSYQAMAAVTGNVWAPAQDVGLGLGQGGKTSKPHGGYLEDRAITEERPYPHSSIAHRVIDKGQNRDYGNLGEVRSTGLEKDPHAPRDMGEIGRAEYHQSKVIDPSGRGGEEAGVTPILHQFGKMDIHDEKLQILPESNNPTMYTGSHDQFSPEPTSLESHIPDSNTKMGNPTMYTGSHDQFSPEPVTSDTSTFLQQQAEDYSGFYNEKNREQDQEHDSNYTNVMSSAASELAHKAKLVASSVTSKLGFNRNTEIETEIPTDTLSVPSEQQSLHEPLDDQPVPGGYGESLPTISTAVADTLTKAKDAVASKLGYGGESGTGDASDVRPRESNVWSFGDYEEGEEVEEARLGQSNIETIETTVASKLLGSGTKGEGESTLESDKGVSVKEYLVEKLKPGEEDQALSKVITEALPLHKHEDENEISLGVGDEMMDEIGLGHVVDEAMDVEEFGDEAMKVEIEGQKIETGLDTKTEVVIKEQVLEPEEMVAHRLVGAEDIIYDDSHSLAQANPAGKSVMDRIKDATGSLFSTSGAPGDRTVEAGNEWPERNMRTEFRQEHN